MFGGVSSIGLGIICIAACMFTPPPRWQRLANP
jgi:hypothetical protein